MASLPHAKTPFSALQLPRVSPRGFHPLFVPKWPIFTVSRTFEKTKCLKKVHKWAYSLVCTSQMVQYKFWETVFSTIFSSKTAHFQSILVQGHNGPSQVNTEQ